jgi:pimeloyl-ACP methyl ester carboxylesterase
MRLLLLPGLDGTGDLFEPLVSELPDDIVRSVVTYPTDGDQRYSQLLTYVKSAVPTDGPWFVLGWSFSGPLALMLAAECPSELRGVILCASFASSPQPWFRLLAPLAQPGLLRLFPLLSQAKALLGGYSSAELRRRLGAAHSKAGPAALASRVRQVLELRASKLVSQCQVPILSVAGSRDWVVPRRSVRLIERQAASIQVATVHGPHLALLTNPKAAAQPIVQFCRAQSDG